MSSRATTPFGATPYALRSASSLTLSVTTSTDGIGRAAGGLSRSASLTSRTSSDMGSLLPWIRRANHGAHESGKPVSAHAASSSAPWAASSTPRRQSGSSAAPREAHSERIAASLSPKHFSFSALPSDASSDRAAAVAPSLADAAAAVAPSLADAAVSLSDAAPASLTAGAAAAAACEPALAGPAWPLSAAGTNASRASHRAVSPLPASQVLVAPGAGAGCAAGESAVDELGAAGGESPPARAESGAADRSETQLDGLEPKNCCSGRILGVALPFAPEPTLARPFTLARAADMVEDSKPNEPTVRTLVYRFTARPTKGWPRTRIARSCSMWSFRLRTSRRQARRVAACGKTVLPAIAVAYRVRARLQQQQRATRTDALEGVGVDQIMREALQKQEEREARVEAAATPEKFPDRTLEMVMCNITRCPDTRGYFQLQMLMLRGNALRDIDALACCTRLRMLDVSFNLLEAIPSTAFWAALTELQWLHLDHNHLGDWHNMLALTAATELALLMVHSNPIANYHNYRLVLANALPAVMAIDGFVITDEELIEGADFGPEFASCCPRMHVPERLLLFDECESEERWLRHLECLLRVVRNLYLCNSPTIQAQRAIRRWMQWRQLGPARHAVVRIQAAMRRFAVAARAWRDLDELLDDADELDLLESSDDESFDPAPDPTTTTAASSARVTKGRKASESGRTT